EALTQLWQRKSACVPQSRDYGATRAACALTLRSRNCKVGSRKLRNRRTQTGKRKTEIGQQRKSEALTQLWQRKSAKTLTLSQREDTAGGERRHKLKITTKPHFLCSLLLKNFLASCLTTAIRSILSVPGESAVGCLPAK